jgi:hypothetical protein
MSNTARALDALAAEQIHETQLRLRPRFLDNEEPALPLHCPKLHSSRLGARQTPAQGSDYFRRFETGEKRSSEEARR